MATTNSNVLALLWYLKKERTAITAEIKAKIANSILFIKITSVFIKKDRNSKNPSAVAKPLVLETTDSL
ncbi:MAG: hypothetical protein M3Q33_07610 [Acidobacteriota bacterium]|nr:hypothetical protein [Acidobacteriota bacterium]